MTETRFGAPATAILGYGRAGVAARGRSRLHAPRAGAAAMAVALDRTSAPRGQRRHHALVGCRAQLAHRSRPLAFRPQLGSTAAVVLVARCLPGVPGVVVSATAVGNPIKQDLSCRL